MPAWDPRRNTSFGAEAEVTLKNAKDFYAAGNYDAAFPLFYKAAQDGTGEAARYLGLMYAEEAWGHFQANELRDPAVGRSASTLAGYLDYFKNQILPQWRDVLLDDVKPVAVERWLRGLPFTNGTKAKIRNHERSVLSLHSS